jgi:hypothetical protein
VWYKALPSIVLVFFFFFFFSPHEPRLTGRGGVTTGVPSHHSLSSKIQQHNAKARHSR